MFLLEVDILWVSSCITLMFLMQAGFLCLESGQVRTINNTSIAIKNVVDFCLAALIFWFIGYSFMFGDSIGGFIAFSEFTVNNQSPAEKLFFLFQLMFCCTAVTIVSGATAERMSLAGYLIVTAIVAGVIYPVIGHWVWCAGQSGEGVGWLHAKKFYDYAGSTVVHSTGGWVALAAILVVGPRLGRFSKEKKELFTPCNLPLSVFGTILLLVGWLGFNGGNEYAISDSIPRILTNTVYAAVVGGMTACIASWIKNGKPNTLVIVNGVLAGLVSITASCNVVELSSVIIISLVGSLLSFVTTTLLERLEIDDVVGAVPVHLAPGIWGTLCVAIFGDPELLGINFNRLEQLMIQAIGVASCAFYSFGVSYLLLRLINSFFYLRVSYKVEKDGLNLGELMIDNILLDLAREIEGYKNHDSSKSTIEECVNSEVAPVVQAYKRTLTKLNTKIANLTTLKKKLSEQAMLDSLTNLYNRRYFETSYLREWQRAFREKTPIALLMIDIDEFKKYNDQYGHQRGDNCLCAISEELIASLSRASDFVSRYGGEEFIVVLPNTNTQGALYVAETIQQRVRTRSIPHETSSVDNKVTLSIGVVCTIPASLSGHQTFLFRADKALYQAKSQGRNQTILLQ